MIAYSDWLHLFAYGGLAMSLAYAFQHSNRPEWQILVAVGLITVGYGVSIELLQSGLAERTFAIKDMLVNAVGAVVAVAVWRGLCRYARFYQARRIADLELPVE
ncbi:VanZ family protein [Halorubrum sp. AD140]|uniref:VanZ family protein n=1 Tax=Halorubrum sp. AD140 TaxID=3050073 RepID=UPI002ACC49F5|nr:VanZ family protein [Halorubrum sp. AD140]MDZ5810504.1 VanZ family protein [Halorubrum sp. AD140]